MTEEGHPVVERVRLLQAAFAEEIVNLSAEELKAKGMTLDTPRVRAMQAVADERGVQVSEIRRTIRDWRKREERYAEHASRRADRYRKLIETYRLPVSPEWLDAVMELQGETHRALWHIGKVKSHMKTLAQSDWYPAGSLRQVKRLLKELERAIEGVPPVGVCPYCKQAPGVMDECAPCFGKGIILEGQMADVPSKYLSAVLPVVKYRGEDRPLIEFMAEAEQEELF